MAKDKKEDKVYLKCPKCGDLRSPEVAATDIYHAICDECELPYE
ncbi:hypothetical protein LCGC14_1679450 [marine sediment metagenome]|uniref:Uncharacterized protein n=1 Tax=marine sediment metagenome TaxID=412755 RepID=A0A0F9HP59_9ZZZZ